MTTIVVLHNLLGQRAAHYSPTCDGPIAKISSHYCLLALETYIDIYTNYSRTTIAQDKRIFGQKEP